MAESNGPLPSPSDPLAAIALAWAAARIQQIHVANHNGANLGYLNKADVANKVGLSETQKAGITPFPSPVSNTFNIHADNNQPTVQPLPPMAQPAPAGWGKTAALGLALLLGGGAAGAGIAYTALQDRDYEVRFYDAQGNPIVVPHVSTRPTGKAP